jgi:hypothetical protein
MKAKDLLPVGIAISSALLLCQSAADTVTNRPSADTTLFETYPDNNLGAADLTSGSTAAVLRSRALIKFDIAGSMPSNGVIDTVSVTVRATRQTSSGLGSHYRLFRLLQPWGEGNKSGVHGAPAEPGEATWNDRFAFEATGGWSVPGAAPPQDFSPAVSASTFVNGTGPYTFASTANLVADVRVWLNDPTNNYGWILISDAEEMPQSVTHFGSREDPTNAPLLVVEFTPPATDLPPKIDSYHVASHTLLLGFSAQAERSYAVEYVPWLTATNWQTLINIPALSSATNIVVSDSVSGAQRYYRLEMIRSP